MKTEAQFCWMDTLAFPDRLVVPRGDPMLYEQPADHLFDSIEDAQDWRWEEVAMFEGDDAEIAYINSWVLCLRTVTELP